MGTVYRPPNQVSFTETITEYVSKINTNDTKIYILGDFNINLFSKIYIPSNEYTISVT